MAWLKLDDQIFLNRKVAQCDTGAKMLYIVGLSYCANQLTDGFIPTGTLPLLAGMAGLDWQIAKQSADKLLEVCLWSATAKGWQIPDYLEYNPSREQVLHNQVVRSEAGKRGGVAKSQQNAKQNSGKSLPPSPSPSPDSEYVTSTDNERVGVSATPPLTKKPRTVEAGGQSDMFGAIAETCQLDAKLKAGQIAKQSKALLEAGYSPAQVRAFPVWWQSHDWRGKNGDVPTLAQLSEKIKQSTQTNGKDPAKKREPEPGRATWMTGTIDGAALFDAMDAADAAKEKGNVG